MKFAKLTRVLVPVLVLALTATAFAANGSATVKLFSAAQLNGKSLAAGEYKVKWDSHSPEADVTFLQGKKAVATAHAKLVDRDQAARENAVVTRANSDGSETIARSALRARSRSWCSSNPRLRRPGDAGRSHAVEKPRHPEPRCAGAAFCAKP